MVMDTMAHDGGKLKREKKGTTNIASCAFEEFYDRSYRRVLAIAMASTGSWSDAEEIAQDAFADAHRRWTVVADYDDPIAFVCRAVLNRSTSRWRRKAREIKALTRLSQRPHVDLADEPYDEEFWRAVAKLPAQQAKAVTLFYVADMPVADVADQLGCSEGATKSHLSRARAALRETLEAPESRGGDRHA